MTPYSCDCCGRLCSRTHQVEASGMEGYACDDCCSYDWEAYGEDADPLLYPEDPEQRAYEERRAFFERHDRGEP